MDMICSTYGTIQKFILTFIVKSRGKEIFRDVETYSRWEDNIKMD